MNESIGRRGFLAGVAALAATPGVAKVDGGFAQRYRELIVIDGNLVPPFDPDTPPDQSTIDQLRSSGLTAVKATIGGSGGSLAGTTEDIADIDRIMVRDSALFLKIRSAADFIAAKRSKRIGIIYSFEAAGMLEGRIDNIDHFHALGVKVMGLSYNLATPFAAGTMSPQSSSGLTPLGHDAVARMNTLGIAIDVSHSDESSSLAAIAASSQPILITHGGCAAVRAHPRNKSDLLLRALAAKGGVIGIYELSYISAGPAQQSMDEYMAHLTHAVGVCGEDHVGIGSDALLLPFDTSPAGMSVWNKDIADRKARGIAAPGEGPPPFVTGLNRPDRSEIIGQELCRRGYSLRVVEKILGTNFQRAFAAAWQ